MSQLQTFLSYVTKEVLTKSEFLPSVSHNRINNIVKNNIKQVLDEKKIFAIKITTDLGLVANSLSSVITTEDFNEASLKEYFEEDNSIISDTYNEIVSVMSEKLASVKKELNLIHSVGSSLVDKVNILFNKYNTNPPGTTSYKEFSLSYEDWKDVSYLGPEDEVIQELNSYLNKDRDDISLTVYFNFISKMNNDLLHQTKELNSCIIPEEKKEKIFNAVASYSGLALKHCKDMLNIILDKNGITRLFSSLEVHSGLTVQKFNELTNLMTKIHKFHNSYDKKVTSQNDAELFLDNPTVKFNLAYLENVKKALIYIKSYYRYQHWNNFIILPTGKVNNDLIEKAEANGIDKNTIRLFVSRTDFSSAKHFTIDVIKSQKENYLSAQQREEEKKRQEFLTNEKGARQLAIQTVLKDYLTSKKVSNAFDLSNAFAREVIVYNQPTEYGIYKAVLQNESIDSWTKEIFDNLGEELGNLSKQAEEVTQRMVQEVQGNVAAKKITNFIIDNYC